jgi:hypothetical protein
MAIGLGAPFDIGDFGGEPFLSLTVISKKCAEAFKSQGLVSKLRETAREQAERDREIALRAKTLELETVETRSTMFRSTRFGI